MTNVDLLRRYKSLSIPLNDAKYLLKDGCDIRDLNKNAYDLLAKYQIFDIQQILPYIILTSNGFSIDLRRLKATLFEYFGVSDNPPIETLAALAQNIKDDKHLRFAVSTLMQTDYEKYTIPTYISPKTKPKKLDKIKTSYFMSQACRNILAFIDLLNDEEKYSKVDNVFDEDKLSLYLAYEIMAYAKRCEQNKDADNVSYALEYLQAFLSSHGQLVKNGFTLRLGSMKKNIKREYHIQDIISFVNTRVPPRKKEDPKEYNYSFLDSNNSFLDSDNEQRDEIKKVFIKYLRMPNKSEELQKVLERKIALYTSLGVISLKLGANSFDGYVGLVLDNGYVILDKFFEDRNQGKIATDNAIYIVRIEDFDKITRMSKSEALEAIASGLIAAVRIIHSGDYEGRVMSYLYPESDEKQKRSS